MLDLILGTNKRRTVQASVGYGLSPESIGFDLNSPEAWDSWFESSRTTTSGLRVSHTSALSHPAFWQAVFMIADDVAGIGYKVLRRDEEGDYVHDPDHPADYLINKEANEDTPVFEALALTMVHALTFGNGYVHIERQLNRDPLNLCPLMPDRTCAKRDKDGSITGLVGGLYYETFVDGQRVNLMAEDVLHIKGLQLWCEFGCDPVTFHRDLIGMGQSAFSFASQFYRRGGRAGGWLIVPPTMKGPAVTNLEKGFEKTYEQPGSHFKTIVLRDGAKFEKATMSPEESQMVETRSADARDFARIFKIPPQKLGLADSVGFASLEQSQRQYLQQACTPWINRMCGQFRLRLLTRGQRFKRSHEIGVDVSSIIQLDEKTVNEVLAIQRQNLIITANEWRQKIGLEVSDDPEADRLVNPNTTAPDAGTGSKQPAADEGSADKPPAKKQPQVSDKALSALVNDAAKRMLSRLCNDAQRHKSSPAKFLGWLDSGLEKHRPIIEAVFAPVACVVMEVLHNPFSPCTATWRKTTWCSLLLRHVRQSFDQYTRPPHGHESLATNVERESKRLLTVTIDPINNSIQEPTP